MGDIYGHFFSKKLSAIFVNDFQFFPLDEVIATRTVFVIIPGSDGRTETLWEPAK